MRYEVETGNYRALLDLARIGVTVTGHHHTDRRAGLDLWLQAGN